MRPSCIWLFCVCECVCVELCVSCCCCCCSRSALTTERLKVSNGTERDWTRVRARKPSSSSTSSSLSQSSLPLSCTQTIAALHETQWQWRNGRQAGSERARERREWERALVFRFPHAACVNCGLWATLRLHCKTRVRLQSAAAASLSLLLLQMDFHYENYLNKFFELRAYPPHVWHHLQMPNLPLFIYLFFLNACCIIYNVPQMTHLFCIFLLILHRFYNNKFVSSSKTNK